MLVRVDHTNIDHCGVVNSHKVSAVISLSLSKFMEVSRKRPYVDNEDAIATKKRALSGPNGSPQVNGMGKEEFDADNLEVRRVEYFP